MERETQGFAGFVRKIHNLIAPLQYNLINREYGGVLALIVATLTVIFVSNLTTHQVFGHYSYFAAVSSSWLVIAIFRVGIEFLGLLIVLFFTKNYFIEEMTRNERNVIIGLCIAFTEFIALFVGHIPIIGGLIAFILASILYAALLYDYVEDAYLGRVCIIYIIVHIIVRIIQVIAIAGLFIYFLRQLAM